ncbi:hypothetical protein [Saccharibacillus deserti]|uniref:hypothetical protein n=1 Tax=Saccharibacillus deserti TaxID=1634444 RepID=UPI001557C60B|nr:hypothetical protein [Saccharibacillus deserti]
MGFQVISFAYDDADRRPDLCVTLLRMVLGRYQAAAYEFRLPLFRRGTGNGTAGLHAGSSDPADRRRVPASGRWPPDGGLYPAQPL